MEIHLQICSNCDVSCLPEEIYYCDICGDECCVHCSECLTTLDNCVIVCDNCENSY